MQIKKGQLQLLLTVLGQTMPNFVEARLRDRVIKTLSEDFKQYDEDRVKICKALCDKDEKGEPILTGNQFNFTDEAKKKQFDEEVEVLQKEEIKLSLQEKEREKLIKLVESTKYSPRMGEVATIDEILGINDSIPTPEEFMPKK